jgi:hypothetical protein
MTTRFMDYRMPRANGSRGSTMSVASALTKARPAIVGSILPRGPIEPAKASGEAAAENALLHPRGAFGQLAVGGEAGELGAGARAAGRAVVRLARAQHVVPALRARHGRRREQLHVIHLGKPLRVHRLPHAPGVIMQRVQFHGIQDEAMPLHEEKPVATVRHVAPDVANAGHVHRHAAGFAVAGDVGDRHFAVGRKIGIDRPDRGVDPERPRADAAKMGQRGDQSNRAMAAHAEVGHVIEVDDPEGAVGAVRRAKQCANHRVGPARFVDNRRAVVIEMLAEADDALLERTIAEIGPTLEHDPRGFTAGVGIDHAQTLDGGGHGLATSMVCGRSPSPTRAETFRRDFPGVATGRPGREISVARGA